MVGHTSIVYSVDAHASGIIVSGSEDCSAKIWKGYTISSSFYFVSHGLINLAFNIFYPLFMPASIG